MASFSFKYMDLAQKLMRRIAVASLQPGDRLPTEDNLIKEYGTSRITVRRALSILEKDGFVSRHRKRGTFVSRAICESSDLHLVRGEVMVAIPNARSEQEQTDHALANLLRGLEHFLARKGFRVHIMSLGADDKHDRIRLARLFERGDLEGICAVGPCIDGYRDLLTSIPLVNSCTFLPDAKPWVGVNMEEVTYTSVGYMLDRGHKSVAMICGSWIDSRAFSAFAKGYRRALEERGLHFRRTLLNHAYEGESLPDLVVQILEDSQRPTGIFAEDWRMTRAVLEATQRLGLRIPDDISLVGCGQNTQYVASSVGITAYIPDNEGVGCEIGRLLIEIIDGKETPRELVFVPGRLVEKGSVAPPIGL
jgi:GntR family transcriptional regulator, arabinose operon transcriptional repressor